jgi:hypothetical protein
MSMAPIRDFIKHNMPRMMEYLSAVSTAKPTLYSNSRLDDREGRHVLNNLTRHKGTLPVLDRESVYEPPHYIDPSRELATITSSVIRHSRDMNDRSRARKLENTALERLCTACFEVETEALQRVNELATRLAQERRRASASAAWTKQTILLPKSPSMGSLPTPKSVLPSITDAPSVTLRLQPAGKPDHELGASSPPHATEHAFGEKPDSVENGTAQWGQPDSVPETLDEGAKRKKSFMRGIFGGL